MQIQSLTVAPLTQTSGYVVTSQKLVASTTAVSAVDHFLGTTVRTTAGIATADWVTRQLYPGQSDKRKHAVVGGAIAGVGGGITIALTHNNWVGALTGLALGTVAGAAKEIRDKITGNGTPDRHDFYATVLGAAAVSTALLIPGF